MSTLLVKNIGILQTPAGSFPHKGAQQGENMKLKDAAVLAEDGIIKAITSDGKLPCAEEEVDVVLDAEGNLVTPGLVEGHTHLVFGGYRQNEIPLKLKGAGYLDILRAGGGSVSALSAAQGIGLVAMVSDLTIGRERYADFEEGCKKAKEEATELYAKLVEAIDKDTEAFNLVSAAFKMPKDTDENKAARSKAIADATLVATEVPFETLTLCMKGLKVTETIVGKSNPNAASDLGVAALNLLAGIKGAWLNVMINLPGVKDEAAKAKFAEGAKMVEEAEAIADAIYKKVLESL